MADGILKVTSTAGVNYNAHNALTGPETEATKIIKAVFDAIKEIPAKPEDYTNKDIDELKTDANFQEAFKAIYAVDQTATTVNALETEIENTFPTEGAPLAQQIWDKIKNVELPYALEQKPKGTKIGTIEDIEILVKILNNFTGEKLKRERKAAKQQSQTKCNTEATQQTESVKCSTLEKPEYKPEPGCKYNETRKACEKDPKTAVAKTNQETGGSTTNVKCSDYDTKDTCEEVNKGKEKPVCGWKKGKDNDDNKNTEKCRNVSFLVTKKFALSADAFLR
uniref:Variant surface glycoprotein 1125.5589 n=1 Tax=Trypanosoma brucei TaxID=5691 RepID=A0A1J0RCP9_9TRYP|nr:variant surface glycoprotein 1125.5589 [Trypanosoma brucei]